jgi:hypothetical protein
MALVALRPTSPLVVHGHFHSADGTVPPVHGVAPFRVGRPERPPPRDLGRKSREDPAGGQVSGEIIASPALPTLALDVGDGLGAA